MHATVTALFAVIGSKACTDSCQVKVAGECDISACPVCSKN